MNETGKIKFLWLNLQRICTLTKTFSILSNTSARHNCHTQIMWVFSAYGKSEFQNFLLFCYWTLENILASLSSSLTKFSKLSVRRHTYVYVHVQSSIYATYTSNKKQVILMADHDFETAPAFIQVYIAQI